MSGNQPQPSKKIDDMTAEEAMKALRIIAMNWNFGGSKQQRASHNALKEFSLHDDAGVRQSAMQIAIKKGLEEPPQSHHMADPLRPTHNLD